MNSIEELLVHYLRTLFIGNPNAYGLQYRNHIVTKRGEITDKMISSHLQGHMRLGFLPLYHHSNDTFSRWLCIDYDHHHRAYNALRDLYSLSTCIDEKLGLDNLIFSSKGKEGYHQYMFFEDVRASTARTLGDFILNEFKPHLLHPECIELFPKQISLHSSQVGNGVWVPYFGILGSSENHSPQLKQFHGSNVTTLTLDDQLVCLNEITTYTQQDIVNLLKGRGIKEPRPYKRYYNPRFTGRLDKVRTILEALSLDIAFVHGNTIRVHCPFTQYHTHGDRTPSMDATSMNGQIVVHCFGCGYHSNLKELSENLSRYKTRNENRR